MQPALKQISPIQAALEDAVQHYQAGAYDIAETLCLGILKIDRRHFDAQNFLGDIYLRQDKFPSARKAFLAALKIHPNSAIALSNLGVVSERLNQTHKARNAFEKAIKLQPDYAIAYLNLARTLNKLGKVDKARTIVSTAVELAPDNVDAHILRGTLHLDANRSRAALSDFHKALASRPQSITILRKLAQAYRNLAQLHDALSYTNLGLEIAPNSVELIHQKADILLTLGLVEDALEWYEKSPELTTNVELHLRRVKCLRALNRHKDALAILTQLRHDHPDNAEIDVDLGVTYLELGRKSDARAQLELALEKDPAKCNAYKLLSGIYNFTQDDPLFDRITTRLNDTTLTPYPKSLLHFALSKGYEDIGDVDQAFLNLMDAHACRKLCTEPYDHSENEAYISDLSKMMDELSAVEFNPTPSVKTPIFIVGMPRSGTTVTEQILSSHTDVFGAGKSPQLQIHLSPFLRQYANRTLGHNIDHLTQICETYISHLTKISDRSNYVVDKMPANFRFVGLMLRALPNVKVVHMWRDPRAVCWSIFKQNFNLLGHRYADDFETLAQFYRLHLDCMDLWRSYFPDRIFNLDYKALTQDQETVTRQLLEFCGLDWQDACLNFDRNERAVATMSNLQVRRKMYTGSLDAWRKYERHLVPLIAALERHGVPFPD